MRWSRDYIVVAGMTVLSAVLLAVVPASVLWLRVVVGIPYTLFLPGVGVMLLCDPDRRQGGLEWFALSIAASIAVTMFSGMACAAMIGLTEVGIVAVVTALTLGAVAIAWARAQRRSEPDGRSRGPAWDAIAGAAAVLACALLTLALSIPRDQTTGPGTTQLWALPDLSGGVSVGARNVDAASERYRLIVEQGGRTIAQEEIDMPKGTQAIFEVKRSATVTPSAPITAVLTDESGIVSPRTVYAWTNP